MKKRWIIVGAVFLIVLVSFGILMIKDKGSNKEDKSKTQDQSQKFTPELLARANDALSKGIIIEDSKNDYYLAPGGSTQWDKPDNSKPYPFNFTDLKSLSIGADEEYLYVKFVFQGIFPDKMPSYEGDDIWSVGAVISEMEYITNEGISDSAILLTDVAFVRADWGKLNASYEPLEQVSASPMMALISPIGIDEHSETIYAKRIQKGYVEGGPGKDYILTSFPLKELNLSLGKTITFFSSTETSSTKYHHECIDFLLSIGESKSAKYIKYELGSNIYEALIPDEEMLKARH